MESTLVSQFMDVTACESQAYAVQQLSSCRWNLETAINLFFNAGGAVDPSPSDAAPSPPVEEEREGDDDGVRAPIPTRVERLYGDSYYDSSRTDHAARRSMWDAPSPNQAAPPSETQGSGWGAAEQPDNGSGNNGDDAEEEQQVNGVLEVSGSGEAEPGNGSDAAEEEKSRKDPQQDDIDKQENDDNGSVGGTATCSDDQEDQEAEQDNGGSDDESEMEGYDLETEDDDDYYDSLLEYAEEKQPRPMARPESLPQIYRLPYELMYRGTFHYAKVHAATEDRFLLVNLQAQHDFASNLQNRDLWANAVVSQLVRDNFVFLLLTKMMDNYGNEGTKVCTFYKVADHQLPAVLVLDPITGQAISRISGTMRPEEFITFADKYTKSKPSNILPPKAVRVPPEGSKAANPGGDQEQAAVPQDSKSSASTAEQQAVPVVEEAPGAEIVDSDDDDPVECDKMYKLRVRFPDGKVVPKEFGCKQRVSKLFTFCRSVVRKAGKTEQVAFRIVRLAGRAFEELHNNGETFLELGLNLATVSVVFDA